MKKIAIIALILGACAYHGPRVQPDPTLVAPITVYADEEFMETYGSSVRAAIESWNDATDCELFMLVKAPLLDPDVVIQYGEWSDDVAESVYKFDDESWPRIVEYNHWADIRHAWISVGHGLGHVLGVWHDRWLCSMMYPEVTSDYQVISGESSIKCDVVLIPTRTAETLRRQYCE